jgi:predicted transcriptional regulator
MACEVSGDCAVLRYILGGYLAQDLHFMTRLLDEAVATVSTLPEDVQDDVARIMLQLAGIEQPPYVLTPEEEADLDASIAEAERGEFATEEEICAIRAKYGR